MRGSWMSSVYVALPVMRRGSSRRLRAFPIGVVICGAAAAQRDWGAASLRGDVRRLLLHELRGGCLLAHDGRGDADGVDDVLVAGAPAEIPLHHVAHLLLGRIRVLREQIERGEDHPRRAESALQPVLVPER